MLYLVASLTNLCLLFDSDTADCLRGAAVIARGRRKRIRKKVHPDGQELERVLCEVSLFSS